MFKPTDPEPIWKALSDGTRRAILDLLRDAPMTTGAIAERFDQSRFAVMKHLETLTACGLVTVERRGRERWNYLNPMSLTEAAGRWLTPFQAQWTGRLGALAQHLEEPRTMVDTRRSLDLDIRQETRLAATCAEVFAALTRDVDRWWGPPYRQAGEGSVIELKPVIGADMIERSSDGHAVIWGRVEEVRAPDRLYLSGRFAVRGAVAGRIHFDLHEEPNGACRLVLSHQAVGAISDEAKQAFTGGWVDLLDTRLRGCVEGR